jgi:hypothetical protein
MLTQRCELPAGIFEAPNTFSKFRADALCAAISANAAITIESPERRIIAIAPVKFPDGAQSLIIGSSNLNYVLNPQPVRLAPNPAA